MTLRLPLMAALLGLLLTTAGCQNLYYGTWERLGWHKRDILVDRVEAARDQQQEVKEQFASTLEQFKSVVDFDGGDLESKYNALNREYEASVAEASRVRDRIDAVESVATALFDEWEAELDQYSKENMRRQSAELLRKTRERYATMIGAMSAAEERMPPVLDAFQDQVLFLKHNLNARAIASIEGVTGELEQDVARLIEQMNKSIAEADDFIKTLGGRSAD